MADSYSELLDRALKQIPESVSKEGRFKIPKVDVDISGNQTTLKNLRAIARKLERDPDHLMKYLLREIGTAGNRAGARGVFQGRFREKTVQEKINAYVKGYVICPVCGRPDTKLTKEGRITMLNCEACGARSSVRKV